MPSNPRMLVSPMGMGWLEQIRDMQKYLDYITFTWRYMMHVANARSHHWQPFSNLTFKSATSTPLEPWLLRHEKSTLIPALMATSKRKPSLPALQNLTAKSLLRPAPRTSPTMTSTLIPNSPRLASTTSTMTPTTTKAPETRSPPPQQQPPRTKPQTTSKKTPMWTPKRQPSLTMTRWSCSTTT